MNAEPTCGHFKIAAAASVMICRRTSLRISDRRAHRDFHPPHVSVSHDRRLAHRACMRGRSPSVKLLVPQLLRRQSIRRNRECARSQSRARRLQRVCLAQTGHAGVLPFRRFRVCVLDGQGRARSTGMGRPNVQLYKSGKAAATESDQLLFVQSRWWTWRGSYVQKPVTAGQWIQMASVAHGGETAIYTTANTSGATSTTFRPVDIARLTTNESVPRRAKRRSGSGHGTCIASSKAVFHKCGFGAARSMRVKSGGCMGTTRSRAEGSRRNFCSMRATARLCMTPPVSTLAT